MRNIMVWMVVIVSKIKGDLYTAFTRENSMNSMTHSGAVDAQGRSRARLQQARPSQCGVERGN